MARRVFLEGKTRTTKMLTEESADIIRNMPGYVSEHRPRVLKGSKVGKHPNKTWGPNEVKLPETIKIIPGDERPRAIPPRREKQTLEILNDMNNQEKSVGLPKMNIALRGTTNARPNIASKGPQRVTVFPEITPAVPRKKVRTCMDTCKGIQQAKEQERRIQEHKDRIANAIIVQKDLERQLQTLFVEHHHLPLLMDMPRHEIRKHEIEASMDQVERDIRLVRNFIALNQ
ncbi:uncharacterized protein LOC114461820 [Gouania willdenowi]|uniref:uncharacterized protein LOC114461820 n=1 Tax=Gouania willdenowi TaxID=441366 RepID=UPI00105668BF|nr:uncharacterized protein LOC114461820 [Gouania willdenowi]